MPATVRVAAAPVATSAVSKNGSVRSTSPAEIMMYAAYATGCAKRERCTERVDAAEAAGEDECGARSCRAQGEGASHAPAIPAEHDGPQRDQCGVGEDQQVHEAGVEPSKGGGEQPGVCAESGTESETSSDLSASGPSRADHPDKRPQNGSGDDEPPG